MILPNIDLFFLGVYFFSLPIAGVTAIQSISLALFVLTFLVKNYGRLQVKKILCNKNIIIVFLITLLLAVISLFFTPDVNESLKEIRSELIKNFIVMALFFLYANLFDGQKLKYILNIIAIVLLCHTTINLYMWYGNNMWPYRAGGLLDSGGGERFGIWATYALSMSIAFLFLRHRLYFVPFIALAILSIVANNTRATYIGLALILIFCIFFIKSRFLKFLILGLIVV